MHEVKFDLKKLTGEMKARELPALLEEGRRWWEQRGSPGRARPRPATPEAFLPTANRKPAWVTLVSATLK